MNKKEYSLEVNGKTLSAEFNDWADQASGSVLVRYGNSAVFATVVMGTKESNLDYFPLSVEYEEKFYAAGAILGSRFMRREGRPSEEAVLSGRIVDRTIRPLFPKGMKRDVQVIVSVLALDEYDTDVLAVIASSLALGVSNIPFYGPVSAMRIGMKSDTTDFIVIPNYKDREEAVCTMDVLACGKDGLINMIEVGSKETTEDVLNRALTLASTEIEKINEWQKTIIAKIGVPKYILPENSTTEFESLFESVVTPKIDEAVFGSLDGNVGKKNIGLLKTIWTKAVTESLPESAISRAEGYYEDKIDAYLHTQAIKYNRRADGRAMDVVRPLYAQAGGISSMIHGTGIFYRGATHVLAALTLGGPGDSQIVDTIEYQESKKDFMLHYNFPPYSVGETGRMGGTNRRMIGHGALAEKALRAVLPTKADFPYTIRIVAESLASNGSTSMASVCAGTLALMDAGVPIIRPVAGIAMGMMSDDTGYKILTDIQGPEDHHGDMDFKVAGTSHGVTAVQMDVKVSGVPLSVLVEAFAQAKTARLQILDVITKEIEMPRLDINPRAPKILTTQVHIDQIGLVIGTGGKTINSIKDYSGCDDITIEDDGTIFITGRDGSAEKALEEILLLTKEYMVGDRFEGTVTRMMDFGAFVRIGPNAEGLVHVSEVAPFRINNIGDALKLGDTVPVLLKEVDDKGRYNLSIKAADPDFATRLGLKPDQGSTDSYARPQHKSR